MLHIAIIDGVAQDALTTKALIEQYSKQNGVGVKVSVFNEGVNFISDYVPSYDLVILEIDLPHIDGLTLSKKLRGIDDTVGIMFLTSKSQYAIYGYEVGALDFVLKPLEYSGFSRKLTRVFGIIKSKRTRKIKVSCDGRQRCFPANDVGYVEVTGHMLAYHLKDKIINCRGNLSDAEEALRGLDFMRIFKSFIINMAYVESIGQRTVNVNGDELILSRSKRREFLTAFKGYLSKFETATEKV